MSTAMIMFLIFVALLLYIVVMYNRLVKLRNRFKNAFAQIDVQLKRRYELIPNLVETAKAYLKHERATLEKVTEARNQALGAAKKVAGDPANGAAMRGLLGAETALAGALGGLSVAIEAYPELKADENMRQLTEELTSTENRVSFARQAYNDDVMVYNTRRETFPDLIFAAMFGFKQAVLFEITSPVEKEAVKVAF